MAASEMPGSSSGSAWIPSGALDRLDGSSWAKRRAAIDGELRRGERIPGDEALARWRADQLTRTHHGMLRFVGSLPHVVFAIAAVGFIHGHKWLIVGVLVGLVAAIWLARWRRDRPLRQAIDANAPPVDRRPASHHIEAFGSRRRRLSRRQPDG